MRSYFFVPASLYERAPSLVDKGVGNVVIEFEDSIRVSEKETVLKAISNAGVSKEYWFRIPLRSSFDEEFSIDFLSLVVKAGFHNIILPKLKDYEEVKKVIGVYPKNNYIILIEHPKLLNQIDLLKNEINNLRGVALGSHDLMSYIGAKHNLINLEYPRQKILYFAKEVGIDAIDIASMELKDKVTFVDEIQNGFDKGFESKFLIHPWQLDIFNEIRFYSLEDVEWAQRIIEKYNEVSSMNEFIPIVINGEIIERPHIKRALSILETQQKYEKK